MLQTLGASNALELKWFFWTQILPNNIRGRFICISHELSLLIFSHLSFQNIHICLESLYPKFHSVFSINWNIKLEIKFWFSFLYWSWDRKHQNRWFSNFQNNWTLKFKSEVCFSFFILAWKTKNQIYLNKYLMKLVAIPLTQS